MPLRETSAADVKIEHYLEMMRYETALALAQAELAENPERARLYLLMGVACLGLDHYAESERYLNTAMQMGYDPHVTHEILGHLYRETGRYAEAEQAYLEVLRLNPNHARVHAAYAAVLQRTGHNRKAELLMKEALRLDPDDEEVVRLRYLSGIAKADRAEQIEAMERYMQVADSEVSKHIQLGLGALFRKRTRDAREHFRQAFLMDPTNPHLANVMAELDREGHALFAPLRLIDRLGGPTVLWITGIGSVFALRALGWQSASSAVLFAYLAIVAYSWLARPLVKLMTRMRG